MDHGGGGSGGGGGGAAATPSVEYSGSISEVRAGVRRRQQAWRQIERRLDELEASNAAEYARLETVKAQMDAAALNAIGNAFMVVDAAFLGTVCCGEGIITRQLFKKQAGEILEENAARALAFGRGSPIASYKQLQAVTRGHAGDIQAHHILEQRHLRAWGYSADEIATAPAQVLSRAEHEAMNRALSEALPTGGVYSRSQVWSQYQKVYANYPEYLEAIAPYFR
jgi:hypothetical protein